MSDLEATPTHLLKPRLVWVGKVLGADVYVDISQLRSAEQKRQLIENILKNIKPV